LKNRFIIAFFFLSALVWGQVKDDDYVLSTPHDYSKDPARNANFIELLGNAGLYSLNFDHIFLYKEKFRISGRAGFSVFPVGYHIEQSYVIENNYIFFTNPHHLELGPGITLQRRYNPVCSDTSGTTYDWENVWFGVFRLGYRFQQQEEGFFFRAGFTPFLYQRYDCATNIPSTHWFSVGVAVGVSF
jgi:hypothetical protein